MIMGRQRTEFIVKIFGEGLTEWYYFDALRSLERFPFTLEPNLPSKSKSSYKKRLPNIDKELRRPQQEIANLIVLVTDLDNIVSSPSEHAKYLEAKRKYEAKGVVFIESHPCIELWFLYHFKPKFEKSNYTSYYEIKEELEQYLSGYDKSRKYYSSDTGFKENIISSYEKRVSASRCCRASCKYEAVEGEVVNRSNIHSFILFLYMLKWFYKIEDYIHDKIQRKISLDIECKGIEKINVKVGNANLFTLAHDGAVINCFSSTMPQELNLNGSYKDCQDILDIIEADLKAILDSEA